MEKPRQLYGEKQTERERDRGGGDNNAKLGAEELLQARSGCVPDVCWRLHRGYSLGKPRFASLPSPTLLLLTAHLMGLWFSGREEDWRNRTAKPDPSFLAFAVRLYVSNVKMLKTDEIFCSSISDFAIGGTVENFQFLDFVKWYQNFNRIGIWFVGVGNSLFGCLSCWCSEL